MIRTIICAGLFAGLLPSAAYAAPKQAEALLTARSGSEVTGKIWFNEQGDKIKVTGSVDGLSPGKHGFHIHETGDCSADDASSAGPHYNPDGAEHGGADTEKRHAGDLGNIVADEKGEAKLDITVSNAKFTLGGMNSIIGRTVIIHKSEDDLKSQPAGNSGDRIACGFIEFTED